MTIPTVKRVDAARRCGSREADPGLGVRSGRSSGQSQLGGNAFFFFYVYFYIFSVRGSPDGASLRRARLGASCSNRARRFNWASYEALPTLNFRQTIEIHWPMDGATNARFVNSSDCLFRRGDGRRCEIRRSDSFEEQEHRDFGQAGSSSPHRGLPAAGPRRRHGVARLLRSSMTAPPIGCGRTTP